jgi:diguanylate cyclase (GGDEF)-like protein
VAQPARTRTGGLLFCLAVGLAGWAFLLVAVYGGVAPPPPPSDGVAFALFLAVILAARGLAFRLVPDSVLALDTAFYVAAVLCLGAVAAGRLVALALTLDSLFRLIQTERRRAAMDVWAEELAYVLYFGGMTGALVMACGWLWGTDAIAWSPGANLDEAVIVARVMAVGLTMLVVHYAVQGVRQLLLGRPLGSYLRHLALPGMLSEASLLPLGAVLVLLWRPGHLLGFTLLALTYLLITFVFNRLSRASADIHQRVRELEILGGTARRLAASLQLQELVETVARETTRAIPEAEVLALAHRGAERDAERFVVDCYDRDRDAFLRLRVPRGEGATGWVVSHQRPLSIPDLSVSEIDPGPAGTEGVRSWLGVPIFMYGGCEGVLAIQSRTPAAFGRPQQRLLESISLQVAAALQNAHLYEMAMVDGLTGLFVRRYFDARIEEEIERAKRYGTPFSVVMMDVDDFKKLNDTHGHLVGDRVLRAVAGLVRGQMRGVDTAARYGGEEIAIILPRTEMVAAYNQAERIRAAIADHRITVDGTGDSQIIGVTASFGIAAYPESEANTAEELVRRADRALYRAKKTGKNRVELYWPDDASDSTGDASAPVAAAPSTETAANRVIG